MRRVDSCPWVGGNLLKLGFLIVMMRLNGFTERCNLLERDMSRREMNGTGESEKTMVSKFYLMGHLN